MTRINTRTQLAAVWPPTATVSREAGHKPMSPLESIREKCRDCSCYQLNEIKTYEAVNCALWPFRAGKRPRRAEARKPLLADANTQRQTAPEDEGTGDSLRHPPASCSRSSNSFRPARVCAHAVAPGNIQTDGFSESDCKMISEAVDPLRAHEVENLRLVSEMQDHRGAA